MSDLAEKNTSTQITFTAISERAKVWILDYCGMSPTVTYRLPNREQTAEQFRKAAKSKQLTITSIPSR